jgi:hypothetical protein
MYEYYDEYTRARNNSNVDAEGRWARQLTWEVARHAVGEEIVVYPLMEKHLGAKGLKLTDNDRADHQVCTYLNYALMWRLHLHVFDSMSKSFYRTSSPSPRDTQTTTRRWRR